MIRLYYGASDYVDVKEKDALAIRYERTVVANHIAKSNRVLCDDQGYAARIAFTTFMMSTVERDALLGHLPDVFKVSIDGGTTYRNGIDVGHEVKREWLNVYPVDLDFLCDADAVSATEQSVVGTGSCANAGNRPATPTFTITIATPIAAGITISDGVRTLSLTGAYAVGHVLTITNWKALDDATEVTLNLDGEYPQIPAGGAQTFVFTGITAPATEIAITYRDTWR